MYGLAKAVLFRMDPEKAHDLTLGGLGFARATGMLRMTCGAPVSDPVTVMGLTFPNRVGLGAGLDKNGAHIDAFGAMGFGFVEVGTVTPRPQPGNPSPRLFRLPEHQGIINRMGFNNHGIDPLVERAKRRKWKGILGINLGKNKDTPNEKAVDDYLIGLDKAAPVADYIAINISSPNTVGLRELQGRAYLEELVGKLVQRRDELVAGSDRNVPLLVKIAPDLSDEELAEMAEVFAEAKVDGVIATNTTLSREEVAGHRHADEAGGLSGAPVRERSTALIQKARALLPASIPIIGVGGITDGASAREKIEAGAELVQVYSGLIYRGPKLIGEAARAVRAASL